MFREEKAREEIRTGEDSRLEEEEGIREGSLKSKI